MKKTPLMLAAEARAGKPLEEALPELLNAHGWAKTVGILEVDRATINYWLLKLGIGGKMVYSPPGYQVVLVKDVDVADFALMEGSSRLPGWGNRR